MLLSRPGARLELPGVFDLFRRLQAARLLYAALCREASPTATGSWLKVKLDVPDGSLRPPARWATM